MELLKGAKLDALAKAIGGHDVLVYLYGCAIGMIAVKAGEATYKFLEKKLNNRRRSEMVLNVIEANAMFELGILEGKRRVRFEMVPDEEPTIELKN